MKKTAAIKMATAAVGSATGKGTNWHFYSPAYHAQPSGPRSATYADSYKKALLYRRMEIVAIAASAMGLDIYIAQNKVEQGFTISSALDFSKSECN